jgi:radical SAM superfamily enzyme YgiQ (UPF0313 family)
MFDKNTNPIMFITTGYSLGKEGPKTNSAQLGHLSMATILHEKGYRVKLLSGDYIEPEELLYTIDKEKISVLCFYTTTEDIFRVMAIVSWIKKYSPDTLIFLGGPHVSISQKDKDLEVLMKCPADLAVRGEGEYTLLSLVEYYYRGEGHISEIKGITWRDGHELKRNPDAPVIENLDELPIPERELLEPDTLMMERTFPRILTGRGCPFNCAFCFDGMFKNRYRVRSVEHVLSEVDYILKTCHGRVITFIDNTFTISPRRVSAICKALRERREKGHDFAWSCLGRVNVLSKNLFLIDEMVESGLIFLQLGVESGHAGVLKAYDKKISLEQIREVFSYCEKAGVSSVLFNTILGGPFESPETFRKSLDFAIELLSIAPGRAFCTGSMMLSPYPMTDIAEHPEKYGIKIIDGEFKRGLSVQKVPFTESEDFNKYDLVRRLYQFEEEIKDGMRKLFPSIQRKTVMDHIEISHRYGSISLWLDVMKLDPGIKVFYNLLRYNLYRDYYDIPVEEIFDWRPMRTYELMYNKDNNCFIKRADGTLVIMDDFESCLYEYSSGKLSLREITEEIKNKFNISVDRILKSAILFYRKMADLFAIIFSRV